MKGALSYNDQEKGWYHDCFDAETCYLDKRANQNKVVTNDSPVTFQFGCSCSLYGLLQKRTYKQFSVFRFNNCKSIGHGYYYI